MGIETPKGYKPDEFLQRSAHLDNLLAEVGMPIVELGETVAKRHLEVVDTEEQPARSHEQQAAEYFGKSLFPSFLRPAG